MHFFDQIKTGGLGDPSTLQGAICFAIVFAFLAWLVGSALRLAVQRLLANDKHEHVDRMAVKFIAKLVRYCVYVFAFAAYAHFVPALSGLGAASLTSIGMISLIVGFAAQNTLGNLIAGILPAFPCCFTGHSSLATGCRWPPRPDWKPASSKASPSVIPC